MLSATPLALSLVGKISEGNVHAIGPHETPYDKVKKSAVSLEVTEEMVLGDMRHRIQGRRERRNTRGSAGMTATEMAGFSLRRSSISEVLDLGEGFTDQSGTNISFHGMTFPILPNIPRHNRYPHMRNRHPHLNVRSPQIKLNDVQEYPATKGKFSEKGEGEQGRGNTDPKSRSGLLPNRSRVNMTGIEASNWIMLIMPLALKIAVSPDNPNDSNTVGLN